MYDVLLFFGLDEGVGRLLILTRPLLVRRNTRENSFQGLVVLLRLFLRVTTLRTRRAVERNVLADLLRILLSSLRRIKRLRRNATRRRIMLTILILTTRIFDR